MGNTFSRNEQEGDITMNSTSIVRSFFFAALMAIIMPLWANGAQFDSGPAGADGISTMSPPLGGAYDRPGRNWDLVLHGIYGKDNAAEREEAFVPEETMPYRKVISDDQQTDWESR